MICLRKSCRAPQSPPVPEPMQTSFTADQLARPEISEAAGILKDCVHYGFCTAVCPTYVLTRDEKEAPRGRIDLIREMLESDAPPDPQTVGHIDSCLSCNSCMTTCAARVDYLHLADIARAHIEARFRRPLADRLLRGMIARTLPDPGRFRRAARMARLAAPMRALMPGRLRVLVDMAREAPPAAEPPVEARTYPAEGVRQGRVALLAGCVQQAMAPRLTRTAIRLLTRHGVEVVVPARADCCGALTLHMGKMDAARASAGATLAALDREIAGDGLDAVLVTASGCGTTVKEYGHLFQSDPDRRDAAARVTKIARDISEYAAGLELEFGETAIPLRVAYHDACSLQHAQKVTEPPRQLLRDAGFVVHDVPERHFCCGSAGTYNLLQPDMAGQLGRRKAGHIESTGADAFAAGNLGCMVQIGRYTALPALHTIELVDWATGGPLPDALMGVKLPEPVTRKVEAATPDTASAPSTVAPPPAGPAMW